MTPALKQRLANLDAELIQLVKPINVLKHLNWPDAVENAFLEGWLAGRPSLPEIEIRVPDWTDVIAALNDFVSRCDGDDPILQFLRRTAWSYAGSGPHAHVCGNSRVHGAVHPPLRTPQRCVPNPVIHRC